MTDCRRLWQRGNMAEDRTLQRCDAPIGPRNTYSNAGYAVMGAIPLALLHTWTAFVFACAMLWLAVGSWWYHAAKVPESAQGDYSGMYSVFGALGTYALLGFLPDLLVAGLMVVVGGVAAWYFAYRRWKHAPRVDVILGAMLLVAVVSGWHRGDRRLLLASLALFAVSWWLWHLDKREPSPTGLWGHMWWHVGTAVAIALAFLAQGGR